jgi:hypothetical protein
MINSGSSYHLRVDASVPSKPAEKPHHQRAVSIVNQGDKLDQNGSKIETEKCLKSAVLRVTTVIARVVAIAASWASSTPRALGARDHVVTTRLSSPSSTSAVRRPVA